MTKLEFLINASFFRSLILVSFANDVKMRV